MHSYGPLFEKFTRLYSNCPIATRLTLPRSKQLSFYVYPPEILYTYTSIYVYHILPSHFMQWQPSMCIAVPCFFHFLTELEDCSILPQKSLLIFIRRCLVFCCMMIYHNLFNQATIDGHVDCFFCYYI